MFSSKAARTWCQTNELGLYVAKDHQGYICKVPDATSGPVARKSGLWTFVVDALKNPGGVPC